MHRRLISLLATALVTGLLLSNAPAQAAPAYTRTELRERADVIEFDVSLTRFMSIYRGEKSGIDRRFDWVGYDGCSLPEWYQPIAARWDRLFTNACYRHDFGYRNYGNGLALGSNATMKARIDTEFRQNMRHLCATRVEDIYVGDCNRAAETFYLGVHKSGKAQTAFYKRKCTANRFCLFDDAHFADRRIALASSEDDMHDVDFNDKTSSVMNRTSVAWIVYDDKSYADRRFCVPPGVAVRDFGWEAYKFNDKTSSAKRLSGSGCPAGTPVIQQG